MNSKPGSINLCLIDRRSTKKYKASLLWKALAIIRRVFFEPEYPRRIISSYVMLRCNKWNSLIIVMHPMKAYIKVIISFNYYLKFKKVNAKKVNAFMCNDLILVFILDPMNCPSLSNLYLCLYYLNIHY